MPRLVLKSETLRLLDGDTMEVVRGGAFGDGLFPIKRSYVLGACQVIRSCLICPGQKTKETGRFPAE